MPKLPDIGGQGFGERPIPRVTGDVAGVPRIPETGLTQSMRGIGSEMIQAGEEFRREEEKSDLLFAEDAYNKLQSKRLELEFSTERANPGFRNITGSAAVKREFQEEFIKRFQDESKFIEDSLSNDRQRSHFKQRAFVADLQLKNALYQHASKEQRLFEENTYKSGLDIEKRSIVANWNNDNAFNTSLARIIGLVRGRGAFQNLDDKTIDSAIAHERESAWSARIEGTLTSDPLLAKKLFNENISNFGPQSRVVLEKHINSAVKPIEAKKVAELAIGGKAGADLQAALSVGGEQLVSAVMSSDTTEAKTKVQTKANLGEWIASAEVLADKMYPNDPVFRDLAVSQVKGYVATIASAQQATSNANHAVLMSAALGIDGVQKPLTLDELLGTPKAKQAWSNLDVQQQRGLLSLIEHNGKEAQGRPIREDSAVVTDLFRRIHAADDDPKKITTPGQLAQFFGKGLGRPGYDWLKKEIEDRQTPEGQRLSEVRKKFFDGINPQFDKSTMMNLDAKGKEDAYKFWQYSTDMERQYRKDGKDPYALYNPNSPDYLGKKVGAFQRTLEEQVRGMADSARRKKVEELPADKKRKEGESIDDYRKRMGMQ